jgi:hypothetical protein
VRSQPTVCATGAGAGVDSAWEQKKLEARKLPENAAESPASSARFVGLLSIMDEYFKSYSLSPTNIEESHYQGGSANG